MLFGWDGVGWGGVGRYEVAWAWLRAAELPEPGENPHADQADKNGSERPKEYAQAHVRGVTAGGDGERCRRAL